jgi:DsbC/DsbD-like thiol-disulfide interchange protein
VNFRTSLLILLLLVGDSGTAFPGETAIVAVVTPESVVVARGQSAQVSIRAKIKKGFHIQANPATDEFLIPTTLVLEAAAGIVPGKPVYPAGLPYRLQGGTKDLLTYEDEVTITLPITVMDSAPGGNSRLTGKLNFQPCDDRKCLFPRSVPITVPLIIVDLR